MVPASKDLEVKVRGRLQKALSHDHQSHWSRAQKSRNSEEIRSVPGNHLEERWDLADKYEKGYIRRDCNNWVRCVSVVLDCPESSILFSDSSTSVFH